MCSVVDCINVNDGMKEEIQIGFTGGLSIRLDGLRNTVSGWCYYKSSIISLFSCPLKKKDDATLKTRFTLVFISSLDKSL